MIRRPHPLVPIAGALLCLTLTAVPTVAAPPPWDEPFTEATAAVLEAAATYEPAEEGARMLLEERLVTYDDEGRSVETHRRVYRIDASGAVDAWSTLNAYWQPWRVERPEVSARVVTADGRVWTLDPATVSDEPVASSLPHTTTDGRRLRVPLPGVAPGAVVETLLTSRTTVAGLGAGDAASVTLGSTVPTEAVRLVFDAPLGLPLRWRAHELPDLESTVREADGRRRIELRHGPLGPWEHHGGSLPGDVYGQGAIRWSTRSSWAEAAALYARTVDQQLAGAGLAETFARATAGLAEDAAPAAVVRALTGWLHDRVRYTGVQFGAAALVPRPPAQTLERGYGDCKDKSTLLVALLREAGIDAHLALLRTGPGTDVDPELPGLLAFDHAIVHVPDAGGEEIWIDATAPHHPPGLLPAMAQNRWALPAVPSGGGLQRTPATEAGDSRRIVTRDVVFAPLGSGTFVDRVEMTGLLAARARSELAGLTEEQVRQEMEEYVDLYLTGGRLVSWEIDGLDRTDEPLRYRIEVEIRHEIAIRIDGAEVAMTPLELALLLPHQAWPRFDEDAPEDDAENGEEDDDRRRHDLEVAVPFTAELRVEVHAPAGFRVRELPRAETRPIGPATLEVAAEEVGDGARIHFTLDSGPRRWSADEVEASREAMAGFLEDPALWAELDSVVHTALREGRIADGVSTARRLVEEHPDNGLVRIRLALALLEGGLGRAAWREARAAVELEPESPHVLSQAGFVLLHGELGQSLGTDWRREETLEILRRARELEPRNQMVRQNLGVALSHNADGDAYGAGADTAGAAEEFEFLVDELGATTVEVNLLQSLLILDRTREAVERSRKMGETTVILALRMAALTRSESVDAALRELTAASAQQRLEATVTGAMELTRLGDYTGAGELLRTGAAALPPRQQDLLRALEGIDPEGPAALDPTDPESVARGFVDVLVAEHPQAAADRLFHSVSGDVWDLQRESTVRFATHLQRSLAGGDLPLEAFRDLMRGSISLRREDFPGVGHRITIETSFGSRLILYLGESSEEGGPLRWVAWNEGDLALSRMGAEALHSLESEGDQGLAAARQWLDWARADARSPTFDDPMAGHPFALFWARGQQGTDNDVRLAAAALLAETPESAPSALEILQEARRAAEEAGDRRTMDRLDLAVLQGYRRADRHEEAADLALHLLDRYPDADGLYEIRFRALDLLDRHDVLAAEIAARLERFPEDPTALGAGLGVAQETGDAKRYRELLELAHGGGALPGMTDNNLAWLDLVEDRVSEHSLELARDGIEGENATSSRHTLASLYAALGRAVEARDELRSLVRTRGEIDPADWYVIGRMAESYGETEAAREAYRRGADELGPLAEAAFNSTRRLVEDRLQALSDDG